MRKRIHVYCPYCGHRNDYVYDEEEPPITVNLCDPEDGGCDKYFAVQARIQVIHETYTMTKVSES